MSRHRQSTITIRNAVPGHSSYTSHRRAHELVERGRATWVATAVIELLPLAYCAAIQQAERRMETERALDAEIDRQMAEHRGGVVYWNGRDEFGMHLPGAVRS